MPLTRKTTPVSSRTRKQTSARTLRNRGGNPATKKAVIKDLTSLLAPVICTAIVAALYKRKELQSLIIGEKPKLSLLYRFPFILVWGFDNTMLDDLKTEFPKFIMNAEIQDLREKKTQYEKQKLYKKQKQYKTTQQCRVESDIVRLYKKNTPCVCFIDGSLKEFEFPNDDNIFVIWRTSDVHEPPYREDSLVLLKETYSKTKFIEKPENTTKDELIIEINQLISACSTLSNSGNLSSKPPLLKL